MEKNKRIEELLLTPRMFYADYNNRVNQLKGLKMLIDEYINENTVMVEIGSFSGISSELFSLHCKEYNYSDKIISAALIYVVIKCFLRRIYFIKSVKSPVLGRNH